MALAADTNMQAAVLYGKEDVRLESVPVPSIGPGELLVRVRTALTCGTDVKVFRRGYHARMIVPPRCSGTNWPATWWRWAKALRQFRAGQRVVAANSAPCDVAFSAGAVSRISARICCSITAPTPNSFAFPRASSRGIPT